MTKFYDYEGVPAFWKGRNFPRVITSKGDHVVWDLYSFFMNATPITEQEFEEMKRLIKVSSK